jgi:hypothetical protein
MWPSLRTHVRRAWRRHRKLLAVGAAAVGAVVLVAWLVLYVLPPTLTSDETTETDARTALIQVVAGLVLLGGLFFTARTLQLNRQGQITERFTRAIDQLGDSKLDVRLGGIYALERIARDSADDHPTIMEVLTAFLREHSAEAAQVQGVEPPMEAALPPGAPAPEGAAASPRGPRPDLQAVLTVLGRRRREHEREVFRLDLTSVHLEGASFAEAHLERANFAEAHLEGATFFETHLQGADFYKAHLEGARLHDSRLKGATFSEAHLEGAFIALSDLENASFVEAHLEEARLMGVSMQGALLFNAHLEGATLSPANLRGASFEGAHLGGANLVHADLEGATFTSSAEGTMLEMPPATADGSTLWPPGFEPRAKGIRIDGPEGETDRAGAEEDPEGPD